MAGKYTLQDIAKRAGVGDGTVSRVLNNHPNVSKKTRDKVLKVVEELDYRPNFSARHMRTQRSQLIGFLTDMAASSPYAGQIIQGAQEAAWEQQRVLLVVNTGGDADLTEAAVEVFLERDVEAIIYAAMAHEAVTLPKSIRKVPTALANCYAADGALASVVPDEKTGGFEATDELLRKGHRRIGFINFEWNPDIRPTVERFEGYREALRRYDVAFDEALVYGAAGDVEVGYEAAFKLMQLSEPPTAIFCANDRRAFGVYNALAEMGLRIPQDVAVMGFDNQEPIATALRPALSSMALPHREMGRWAVTEVFRQAGEEEATAAPHHRLPCPIVRRESC
jgi:LacI family transcriptional regulator